MRCVASLYTDPSVCSNCSTSALTKKPFYNTPFQNASQTNLFRRLIFPSSFYTGSGFSESNSETFGLHLKSANKESRLRISYPFAPIAGKSQRNSKSNKNQKDNARSSNLNKEILKQKTFSAPNLSSDSSPSELFLNKNNVEKQILNDFPDNSISNLNLNDDLTVSSSNKNAISTLLATQWRKLVRSLSSFPLAIGVLAAIAAACALGTVIEQGESPATYMRDYPEEKPVLGFLTWRIILALSFDHLYSSPWFLLLLLLLAFSLMACTSSRQWPMAKVAQRWSFYSKKESIMKMGVKDALENGRVSDLATLLMADGYQVFLQDRSLYGFKGLLAKLAPIGVHGALLTVMLGGTFSAIGGYHGTAMIPQGTDVSLYDSLIPNGFLSVPSSALNNRLQVNRFYIDYRANGEVEQFNSDLSVFNNRDEEVMRKTISVNDPMRVQGVTIYQTDWSISTLQLRILNSNGKPNPNENEKKGEQQDSNPNLNENLLLNLPFASLAEPGSSEKYFGTFLPLRDQGGAEERKGISFLARDLQTVAIYDSAGQFAGIRRPGSQKPITVDGVDLVLEDLVGSTGLEMKMDPAVPLVYAGFGAVMVTTCISYLSHSQVWAFEEDGMLFVGGKSNRAKLSFENELNALLNFVPVVLPSGNEEGEKEKREGELIQKSISIDGMNPNK